MSGKVVHFEVPFDDAERATSFYREVFGWSTTHVPELDYTLVNTGPTDENGWPTEAGFIGGGMLKREAPNDRPTVVIDVADIEATLAKIEAHGGSTVQGRQQVGSMGWAAYFTDAEGNLMGLWQSAEEAP